MVTDEERDYMYRLRARADHADQLGIRRRLAPWSARSRQIELMKPLLMSLPGRRSSTTATRSAWGQRLLGDRNGCARRCSGADRNAGYSRANPHA